MHASQRKASPFTEITKKHFDYLFAENEFKIVEEKYYPELMGGALLHLESNKCGILFVLDRRAMTIELGPPSLPQQEWLEFSDTVRFFAPEIDPVYKFLDEPGYETHIEFQASGLSKILKEHCTPLLEGDFSMYDVIKDIERKRVRKMLNGFGTDPKKGLQKT